MNQVPDIASSTETGSLGFFHLKRFWSAVIAERDGMAIERKGENILDMILINALGLGLHQTLQYVYSNSPSFNEFEAWIIATAGVPDRLQIERFNADIEGKPQPDLVRQWLDSIGDCEPVLSRDDLAFWEKNGYVVLKDAVPESTREAAEKTIWQHVGADPNSPNSWYKGCGQGGHGIMVELIQHPTLKANRHVSRIHKAFSQLWNTTDLWVTSDRCGFHPPQRDNHPFPGPDLHWDMDFTQPQTFTTQGILYLTDTPPEQGALTLVPGFQHRLPNWLASLEPGADPQQQDLHALGSIAVGAQAGDMVIWHHALPHGSRPNLGERPRMVQYINMLPGINYNRI